MSELESNSSAPRKRGRPRKNPQPEALAPATPESTVTVVKRGRGRPRKESAAAPVEATAPAPTAEKRGRGRPRKTEPVVASAPKPVVETTVTAHTNQAKRGRGRPRKNEAPVAKTEVAVEASPTPSTSFRRGRGRPRKEDTPTETTVSAPYVLPADLVDDLDPLPIPSFRARSTGGAAQERPQKPSRDQRHEKQAQKAPQQETAAAERDSDRGRRRRRVGTQPEAAATPEPAAVVAPEPTPEPPKKAQLQLVAVPSHAPQIIVRNGTPTLVRDGRVYPPLFFFGSASDETRLETVLEEMKLAASAEVHLFSLLIDLVVSLDGADEAAAMAGYLVREAVRIDPECQVMLRVAFTAPNGWEKRYPRARYTLQAGGTAEPSLCDEEFWGDAEECLTDLVRQLMLLPEAGHILGIHLERGEWFLAAGSGYDTSAAAEDAFRNWARKRYGNDQVALCAAWFDGQAMFETISVPEYTHDGRAGEEFVRTGRKTRRLVDYHLFLSDIAVDTIGRLAHSVKVASEGMLLVGASYGYTFEWSHPSSGHLSLGKLLRNPEVDIIAGPPSYKNREPGGSSPFPGPIDSFALNGKLYISEEDYKTPISGRHEPDDFNPVMKTPQALESVHWRGLGACAAHSSGVCWMDLWGNGWLNTSGIWERAKSVRKSLINRMAADQQGPDVAVFIDERSLAYLVDPRAFELLVQNVRESVLRSGLSVGFYLLSDLAHREHFPESKLYVFMNAWDIRSEVRSAIKRRLQRDGKVLFWLFVAGLFDGGRDAIERVREVTGIAVKRQPYASRSGSTLIHKRHPLCQSLPDKLMAAGSVLEPSYFAIPEEESIVLAEYSSTGLPSFLMRENRGEDGNWTSVFLGEAVVTPALFRSLAAMAGAHVWSHSDDVVHAQPPFVSVHCKGAGTRTLLLPDKWQAYSLQTHTWMQQESSQVKFQATDGSTHNFLVGLKSEIESIIERNEEELLAIAEIPERPSNTIDLDEIQFDVTVMRLDEWVEDSWSEEMSEDLLLRPSQVDENYETAEVTSSNGEGRRRGRRRRQRGGSRNGDGRMNDSRKGASSNDFDVMEMNVVFRKRD